jgi:hypothetical protein
MPLQHELAVRARCDLRHGFSRARDYALIKEWKHEAPTAIHSLLSQSLRKGIKTDLRGGHHLQTKGGMVRIFATMRS